MILWRAFDLLFCPAKMSAVIERWHFLIFQFFKTWWEMKSPRNSEFPQVIDMAISYLQLIFPLQTYPQHPLYIKSISIGIIKMTSYFINHKSFCRGGYYCNCFSIEIKNSSFSFTTHVNTVVCFSPKTILHVAIYIIRKWKEKQHTYRIKAEGKGKTPERLQPTEQL